MHGLKKQSKNDAFVNVTVCRQNTTAARIETRRGFSVSTAINPVSAGFSCWHRYCAVIND